MINGIRLSVTTLTSIGVLDKVKENLLKRKNELRSCHLIRIKHLVNFLTF